MMGRWGPEWECGEVVAGGGGEDREGKVVRLLEGGEDREGKTMRRRDKEGKAFEE